MRALLPMLLLAAGAVPLHAQQKLFESIEVRVVNVDVVVTDKAGRPVPGLTRGDFQLFENGKAEPITNFYEVRGSGTAAALPTPEAPAAAEPAPDLKSRRFLMFLDDYSLSAGSRKQVLVSLGKFIETDLQPGDTVSIVEWLHGIHIIVPFTSDRKQLQDGIARLHRHYAGKTAEDEENHIKSDCRVFLLMVDAGGRGVTHASAQQECMDEVDVYEQTAGASLRELLSDIARTTGSLAGIDGKKVLLLAGSELPERPGLALRQFALTLFGVDGAAGMAVMQSLNEQFSIEKLAREANANGVTIYAIDARGLSLGMSAEEEPVQGEAPDLASVEDFIRYSNNAKSFHDLAAMTGGTAVLNTPNFDLAFESVASDTSSYYSLGYRPSNPENTSDRAIVVKVRNRDLRVRGRMSVALRTVDERMGDRVIANIFHDGVSGGWPIGVRAGSPAKSGRYFKVPIDVSIPSTVTLLPQGDHLTGGFTVYVAVADADGRISNVVKRPNEIRLPAKLEPQLRSRPLQFSAEVLVRPGANTLSVAVVDSIGGTTGFARMIVNAR